MAHSKTSDVDFTCTIEGDVICLEDIGTGRSITNGAEVVVAQLFSMFGADLAGKRIIYRDTMGNWDGLAHHEGRFLGFVPLGGIKDGDRAIEAARAHANWPVKGNS